MNALAFINDIPAESARAAYAGISFTPEPNSHRPSERLFLAIKKGDTPKTNLVSKIVLEWTDEFLMLINA